MPPTDQPSAPHHPCIRSVAFTGGFLDGCRLDFADGLNCIVGGRGTGKTTVLEAIRFALDLMPFPDRAPQRLHRIEKLLEANLGDGTVRVEIETAAGTRYTVARALGENPVVLDEHGRPLESSKGGDLFYGPDVYSQGEIEDLADDASGQSILIDRFAQSELAGVEDEYQELYEPLDRSARAMLASRKAIADLREGLRELPDVVAKLQAYEAEESSGSSGALRAEHENHALRARESKLLGEVRDLYAAGIRGLGASLDEMRRRFEDAFDTDLAAAPNRALLEAARAAAEAAIQAVQGQIDEATGTLGAAHDALEAVRTELGQRHAHQDKEYRDLLDRHQDDRMGGLTRVRLEQQLAEIKGQERKLHDGETKLAQLTAEREALFARLSDIRARCYRIRLEATERLSRELAPTIRVRLEECGNSESYHAFLAMLLDQSGGLREADLARRIVERIPPREFVARVQGDDRSGLARVLEIDVDRATRLVLGLKDQLGLFGVETAELHDRPILELKVGSDYRDAASLSTGQKCTAVLPVLLWASERPLLIDQPEDNLDNAFIVETLVQSLRAVQKRRQLIVFTHNPNIPVLGEAERVFVLGSNGPSAEVTGAGSVDELGPEILRVLEGGRDAFEARRARYGRSVPEKP